MSGLGPYLCPSCKESWAKWVFGIFNFYSKRQSLPARKTSSPRVLCSICPTTFLNRPLCDCFQVTGNTQVWFQLYVNQLDLSKVNLDLSKGNPLCLCGGRSILTQCLLLFTGMLGVQKDQDKAILQTINQL